MLEGGADVGGDGNEGRDGGGRRRARGGTDLDAQRAYVEALDAVAWLAPERPSGRRRVRDLEVVVPGPRTGDLPQVRTGRRADVTPPRTVQDGAAPGAPQDLPPAPPLTRRERREAERRAAERRLAAPQAYDGEERRVGERRRGERRAALAAERARQEEVDGVPPVGEPVSETVLDPAPAPAPEPVPASEAPTEPIPVTDPFPEPVPVLVTAAPPPPPVLPSRRALRADRPMPVPLPSGPLPPGHGPFDRDAARPGVGEPAQVRPRAAGYPRLTPPVVLPDPAPEDDTGPVPGPAAPGPVARLLRRLDPVAALLVVVVVAGGLALSIGTVRALSGDSPPPLPSASAGAGVSASLLVGVGSPEGLLVGAVLGRDGATAVSLLLPGNALVDDGSGLGPISRPVPGPAPSGTSTATSPSTGPATSATASRTASGAARPAAVATPVAGAAAPPSAATVADTATRVGDALGVRLDGAWVLSPVGLAGLVDAAGGVQVDVDDSAGAAGAGLPPGAARLNGAQAVAYATTLAANEQAEARLSRFQQVLAAVVLALPLAEDRLAAVVTGLAAESAGTVPAATVADLLLSVRDAAAGVPLAGTIVPLRIVTSPDGGTAGRALDGPATQGLVARLLPGAVSEAAEDVAVRVVDGVGRDGLTSAAVSRLRAASLGADVTTAQATTAPPGSTGPGTRADDPPTRSTVTVAGSDDASRLLGARVAAALHLPADAVLLGEPTAGADVLVVLGPDFAQDVAQHGV